MCYRGWLLICNKFNARGSGYELEGRFAKFSEITQCNGHYAVQDHSRSPILVPIEISYTTNLAPILHRFRVMVIFAGERGVPHFHALARGGPLPISL